MGQALWDVPRTEEGLQQVLNRIEGCRAANNHLEIGNGLLKLCYLVKWVRSDTAKPPFERAHELALEALEAFRQAKSKEGEIRALVASVPFSEPGALQSMLAEAERLAETLEDENYRAMVLAAKARSFVLRDEKQKTELSQRALDIYKRTGNERGQAQCLFTLSISSGTSAEKRDFAIEAASLYRKRNEPKEARRCMTIAFMYAEGAESLTELQPLAEFGLQDALASGDLMQEGRFCAKLARIFEARGLRDEANRYRLRAAELEDADGLTPTERWENSIEATEMMISMAKGQGSEKAANALRLELKRLRASEPEKLIRH